MPYIRKGIDSFEPRRMKFILRKQVNHSLKDWDDLSIHEQRRLEDELKLSFSETPVIALPHQRTPLLITTKNIIWKSDGVKRLDLADVIRVDVPNFMYSDKSTLHELWLRTNNAESSRIETPPGEPFFAVWNLFIRFFNY